MRVLFSESWSRFGIDESRYRRAPQQQEKGEEKGVRGRKGSECFLTPEIHTDPFFFAPLSCVS